MKNDDQRQAGGPTKAEMGGSCAGVGVAECNTDLSTDDCFLFRVFLCAVFSMIELAGFVNASMSTRSHRSANVHAMSQARTEQNDVIAIRGVIDDKNLQYETLSTKR
jgi:hypothetical protein